MTILYLTLTGVAAFAGGAVGAWLGELVYRLIRRTTKS